MVFYSIGYIVGFQNANNRNLFELYYFIRNFHLSKVTNLVSKEFEDAKANLGKLEEDPGNDVKLKLYALFKQVPQLFFNKKEK